MIRIITINLFLLAGITGKTQTNHSTKNVTTMTNKERATAINKAIQQTDATTIEQLVREDYIQHTPVVADGRKGLLGLVSKIEKKEIPAPKINTVRVIEEGDYVVLHHEVYWPGRKAMVEIFRFSDGLAAEHWSGITDHPETTANGHTMLDGPVEIEDRHLTQQNKKLARSFVETVLMNGLFDKLADFYHPAIIQHNPFIDNTVEGLLKGVAELQQKGMTIQIEKIHLVLGEGNFVWVFSEGKFAGKPTAFFDLFRIEKGIIVEHWDVLQEVPGQMAHENGMFTMALQKH